MRNGLEQDDSLLEREVTRAVADEHHVGRLLHHQPRETDRILHVGETADRAGASGLPAHH